MIVNRISSIILKYAIGGVILKRMIIVEDEPFMSDFLANYINWSDIDVEILAVFDNGADGFAAIKNLRPDIVMTDIKMPQMDGLTMIEQMIKEGIDSRVLILSSHSEFHMVKEAFKLGISDYILKTELDEQMLKEAVLKLIRSEHTHKEKNEKLRDLLYKKDVVKAFIFGNEKISDCKLKLRIKEQNLSVIVIKLLDYENVLEEEWDMESELLKYGIMNVIEELLDNEGVGEIVENKNDEFIVLISDYDRKNSDELTQEIAQKLSVNFENVFGFTVCSGYCGFENSGGMLRGLYNNAKCASEYTFMLGRHSSLNYRDIKILTQEKINLKELIFPFSEKIESHDFVGAVNILDDCMSGDIFSGQLGSLYEFCDMCYFEIDMVAKQLQLDEPSRGEYKRIISTGTLKELKAFFNEEILKLSDVVNENVALIPRVKKYIDENYFKNISLESISETFGVGYQKLSREFKKKTGKNLKKYLIEIRMNEAMRLIENSEYMLYEIADMVGYANYENFSRMFYNHFKRWPRDIERP